MKKLLLLLFMIGMGIHLLAQDEITFRNGDILVVKVMEVGTKDIVYKKAANPDGPSYSVEKEKVFMIKYKNGTKDVFGAEAAPAGVTGQTANKSADDTVVNSLAKAVSTPATLYLYRPGKMVGSINEIIVGTFVPDEVIVNLRNNCWFRTEYPWIGQREFVHGIFSVGKEKLAMNLDPGKTYFIRCTIAKGFGMASRIEQVDEATAEKEMKGLKEQKAKK